MKVSLHHVHLFASNIDESIQFYHEMFEAEILFDMKAAGARNVLIMIGNGKINFYDQAPKDGGRGVVHHLGIETDDLDALVKHMKNKGYKFKYRIRDFGNWRYIMARGPDDVLMELFQILPEMTPDDQYRRISSLK